MSPDPRKDPGPTSVHVRRAADGDADSLAWLVERLSPLLSVQAEYRLGPLLRGLYDPEDLVNETWIVAMAKIGELGLDADRSTPVLLRYLSTSLLNCVRNLVRKHARAAGAVPVESAAPAAEQTGVMTRVTRTEHRETVRAALADLDEADREILVLRGIEQQPNKTIAMLLGLGPSAVSMRYQRALERLRGRLPDSVFEELGP